MSEESKFKSLQEAMFGDAIHDTAGEKITTPYGYPKKPTEQSQQSQQTEFIEPTQQTTSSELTAQSKRTSPKQRKASMDEYRQTFLIAPKIIDRQTVFISRELRDRVDVIVRRLGERKILLSDKTQLLQ